MAKNRPETPVDAFIFERWAQARDLAYAFKRTSQQMRRRLRAAAEYVERSSVGQGFHVRLEPRWAELELQREDWGLGRKGRVVATLGAIFPVGYFRVGEPSAYLALQLRDMGDESEHRRFRDLLHAELGGLPSGWEDRTDNAEWKAPMWAPVPGTSDAERIELARYDGKLRAFAVEQLAGLTAFADPITRAARRYGQQ